MSRIPGKVARVCMKVDHELVSDGYDQLKQETRTPVEPAEAHLVTSLIEGERRRHAPVLDLDVPHALVPSSTPGHAHLYLDVPMSWWRYKRLLKALAKAGVIEQGFVNASIMRGHTDVRVPWLKKEKS